MRVIVLVLSEIPALLHFPTERADNSSHLMRLSFFVCFAYSFFVTFKIFFVLGYIQLTMLWIVSGEQ